MDSLISNAFGYSMEQFIENKKTAIMARERARSERHGREAEEKKEKFMEKLRFAEVSLQDAREMKAAVNGADAESKRSQLMTMMTMPQGGFI